MALALPACRIQAVDPYPQALAYGPRRALKLGAGNIAFATAVAAEGQYQFIDAGRRDTGEPLVALARLLAPGGLLRLNLARSAPQLCSQAWKSVLGRRKAVCGSHGARSPGVAIPSAIFCANSQNFMIWVDVLP